MNININEYENKYKMIFDVLTKITKNKKLKKNNRRYQISLKRQKIFDKYRNIFDVNSFLSVTKFYSVCGSSCIQNNQHTDNIEYFKLMINTIGNIMKINIKINIINELLINNTLNGTIFNLMTNVLDSILPIQILPFSHDSLIYSDYIGEHFGSLCDRGIINDIYVKSPVEDLIDTYNYIENISINYENPVYDVLLILDKINRRTRDIVYLYC